MYPHLFFFFLPGASGSTVEPPAPAPPAPTAAGRSRRRQRYIVEIDDEEFEVSSPEEAEALLTEAKELAHQRAAQAIERAQKATKRPKPKVLADAKKAMPVPVISASPEIEPVALAVVEEIRSIYRDAMRVVEMMALLRRADEEEEESLLLLLL